MSFNIFLNTYIYYQIFNLKDDKKIFLLFSPFSLLFFYSPTSSGTHEKSEQLERKAKAFIWQPDQR